MDVYSFLLPSQQSRFLALVGNYDRLSELYDEAANSQDAATLQTLKTMDSIETKINQLKTTFQEFYTSTGIEDFIKLVLDGITEVINYLNGLPKVFGKLPVQAISVGASLITGIKVILRQIVTEVSRAWEDIKKRSVKGGADAGKAGFKAMLSNLKSSNLEEQGAALSDVLSIISGITTTIGVNVGASAEKDGLQAGIGALLTGAGTMANFSSIGAKIGTYLGNPIAGGIIGAVAGAITSLPAVFDSFIEDAEEKLERLTKEAEEARNQSVIVKSEYKNLKAQIEEYEKLKDARFDSAEAMEEYKSITNELVEAYPEILRYYDEEGNAIIEATKLYDKLNASRGAAISVAQESAEATYKQAVQVYENAYRGWKAENLGMDSSTRLNEGTDFSSWKYTGLNDEQQRQAKEWFTYQKGFSIEGQLIDATVASSIEELIQSINIDSTLTRDVKDVMIEALTFEKDEILDLNQITGVNSPLWELGTKISANFSTGNYDYLSEIGLTFQDYDTAENFSNFFSSFQSAYDIFRKTGDLLPLHEVMNSSEFEQYGENLKDLILKSSFGMLEGLGENDLYVINRLFDIDWSEAQKKVFNSPEVKAIQAGAQNAAEEALLNNTIGADEDSGLAVLFSSESPLLKGIGSIINKKAISESTGEVTVDSFSPDTSWGIALNEVQAAIADHYNSLGETARENIYLATENYLNDTGTLMQYWESLGSVGQNIIFEALREKGLTDATTLDGFDPLAWLAEANGLYETAGRIDDKLFSAGILSFVNYKEALTEISLKTSQAYEKNLNAVIAQYTNDDGKISEAGTDLLFTHENILQSIIKSDEKQQAQLETVFQSADLFTLSGIIETLEQLEDAGFKSDKADSVYSQVKGLMDQITINLNTEWETYFSNASAALGDLSDALSQATEGMKFDEAVAMASKLDVGLGDFEFKDGEFFFKNAEDIVKAYDGINENLLAVLNEKTDARIKEINNQLSKALIYGADQTTIEALETEKADLETQQTENQEALTNYTNYLKNISLLNAGFYQQFADSISGDEKLEFSSILAAARQGEGELRAFLTENGIGEDVIDGYVEAIMSGVDSIGSNILDAIINGIDTGKTTIDVSYLTKDTGLNIGEIDITDEGAVAEAFGIAFKGNTKAYNDAMTSYLEARTKDYQSVFESIVSNPNEVDLSTIQEFANLLGQNVDTVINDYFTDLGSGIYQAKDTSLVYQAIQNVGGNIRYGEELINDHFQDYLDEILGFISSGISGDLGSVELTKLQEYFDKNDANIKLEAVKTAEGFKLTNKSLLEAYSTLKNIDALAADVVLEELADSAEDADESLGNIYNVLERIEDLTKQINTEGISENRRKALEAELDVATEIRDRLMEAGDAFNFMEQDLPTGVTNPLSAWEGAGAAMDVLNGESFAKDGYMGVQDFTNMINFIGDEYLASAGIFEDKANAASELIRAGYKAIKVIDGEAVVDWSGLATQFQLSGDELAAGVTEGIHTLAETQIDIIDAEIAVLETVVKTQEAFDSIDADDSGDIDISEFFPTFVKGEGLVWAHGEDEIFAQLASAFGKDFTLQLETTSGKITTFTLTELSNPNIWNTLSESGKSGALNFINNYWSALENTDWSTLGNGENLQNFIDSINQVLSDQGRKISNSITSSSFTDSFSAEGLDANGIKNEIEKIFSLDEGALADLDISQDILDSITADGKVSPLEVLDALFDGEKITQDQYNDYIRRMIMGDGNNVVDIGFTVEYSQEGKPTFKKTGETSPEETEKYLREWLKTQYPDLEISETATFTINADGTIEITAEEGGIKDKNGTSYSSLTEYVEKNEPSTPDTTTYQASADIQVVPANITIQTTGANGELIAAELTTVKVKAGKVEVSVPSETTVELENADDGLELSSPIKISADVDSLEITSIPEKATVANGEGQAGTQVVNIGAIDISADASSLTINIPEGLDTETIGLIEQFNAAIGTAKSNGPIVSGITVTISGITETGIDSINSYNEAVESMPEEASSSVSSSVTISVSDLLKIAQLKAAVEALKSSPNIDTTIAAQAEGTALTVVSDMLALYGYNGKTAELIFNAIDPQETLTTVKEQIDGIQSADDNPIQFQVDLLKGDIEAQLANLTKTEEKLIKITYEELESVGEYKSGEGNYRFKGIDNSSGNLMTYSGYSSLQSAIDAIKSFVYNNQLNEGQYTIEKIESDNLVTESTAVTVTAGTVDLSGEISFPTATVGESSTSSNIVTGNNLAFNEPIVPVIDTAPMIASVEDAASAMASLIESGGLLGGALAAKKIQSSLDNIKDPVIRVKYPSVVTVDVKVNVDTVVKQSSSSSSNGNKTTIGSKITNAISSFGSGIKNTIGSLFGKAKGNVALAKGTKKHTLMGELGPELVVSGGRYYVVGQNGAEFVDLADDAIVFNHLQTKKLLGNGSISGTGSPVTNEKKAVSYATGNANGSAMASASDALAALYELRAMWSALLGASAKDLGQKAANSGGGGGGNNEDNGAYLHDLDRWYNLLRQIAKWEQKITYEQAKRQNLQSGYDYHESLQKELDMLKKQQEAYSELARLQRNYYNQRRKDLQDTIYSQIFTYDEDGLMQYTESGFDILENLNLKDKDGDAKSAKNQFKELYQALGLTAKELKNILRKNEDGTKLESDDYKGMMENFWSGIDGWMSELDSLYDDMNDHLIKIEENQTAQEEILREYTDARLSVEEKLLTAMTDMAQNNIDALQDNLDALTEASENYIDGLSNALEQERNMYQQNEYDKETQKLQRQLAILQRSGGSASEIKALQEQLDSRMQEDYFKQQQEQIDRLQEAADIQNEKLQRQIDIATETLEYQKENGLFWPQIMEMMATWTPEALLAFIRENTNSYKEDSPTQNEEKEDETKKEFELLDAQKENEAMQRDWEAYLSGTTYSDEIKEKYGDEAYKAYADAYKAAGGSKAEGSIAAAATAANAVFDKGLNVEAPSAPEVEEEEEEISYLQFNRGTERYYTYASSGSSKKGEIFYGNGKAPKVELLDETDKRYQIRGKDGKGTYFDGRWISKKTSKGKDIWKKYKEGGLVDYTGPAWVDGSKSKPEAFLSADDTAMLKSKIFSDSDYSLRSVVESIQGLFSSLGTINNSTVSDNGIVFENVTVEIQSGVISSDYDARRAGELALEEMMKIARRSTNIGVSRR